MVQGLSFEEPHLWEDIAHSMTPWLLLAFHGINLSCVKFGLLDFVRNCANRVWHVSSCAALLHAVWAAEGPGCHPMAGPFWEWKKVSFLQGRERGAGTGRIAGGCGQAIRCSLGSALRPEISVAPVFCLLSGTSESYANKPFKKINCSSQTILEIISQILYQPTRHLKDVLYFTQM